MNAVSRPFPDRFVHDSRIAPAANILCVGMGWFPSTAAGLNRYVYELMQQLAQMGDRLELCGIDLPKTDLPKTDLPIALTNLASPTHPLLQRWWSARYQFAHRQLSVPDAINLHFALYSLPLLSRLPHQVPVTFTFHGPWALESQQEGERMTQMKQWLESRVYHRCDRFIVLSHAFGQVLHETYRIPWEKIHIIPGGVNTTAFQSNLTRQAARIQLNWPCDRPVLFTPRRLVHRVGIDRLLQALVQVKRVVPDVWLAIAGKGPLRDSLQQQVNELGLTDHVQFLGYVPDEQLPVAYQAADLTVVPSQSLEGFGLILVESLACGTPALCTPVGGMPEVITPFSPDLVTADANSDAIADRLIEILTGSIALPSRTDCREYACEQFDWRAIAPRVRDVLLT